MTDKLADQIARIEPGGHLCLFYEKDPAEQMPALVPFITQGLSRGEQFIYIADDLTVGELAGHLARNGIDVVKESASGRLNDPEIAAAEAQHSQSFQSLKISGPPRGMMALFASHPPIEERIARLEHGV